MDRNLRIRMLLEAGDRATKPLRDIAQGSSHAARAFKATRDRLGELNRTAADISAFRNLKRASLDTTRSIDAAENKVADLARQMAAAEKPSRKLSAEFNRAKRDAGALKDRFAEQSGELQRLRGRLGEAGISTTSLAGHERRLRQEIGRTNEELSEQQRRLTAGADRSRRLGAAKARFGRVNNAAVGLAASGAAGIGTAMAIGAPIITAAREAMTFEDAMADVRKVVDGLDDARAFQNMSNDILALSKRLPMAAEGIAAIVAAGGQSGIKGRSDLLQFAEDATKMGIAFDITADEAGETMAKWRTAFGLGRDGVVRLADQVNYLGNTTAANAPLITDIVTRIGPLGSVGGLGASSIAALGATLGAMGIESEIAATGIKNTMLALTKGEAATRSQQAAFQALGLSSTDVARRMQQDANSTIIDVMERLSRLPKEVQAGTLTQLFGSESVAAIAPMLTQLDTLRANLAAVSDATKYQGSMEAEYASRAATTSNAVQLLQNRTKALQIALGNELLPVITKGAEWFGTIADKVARFARANPVLARGLMIGLAAFAALFAVLGGGAILIAGLLAPFAALSFAATALGIGLLPVIGIAAAIIAGFALLGIALYALWANWDTVWGGITAGASAIWSEITGAFAGGIGGIAQLLMNFSPVGLLYRGFAMLMNYLGVAMPAKLTDAGGWLIQGLINGITSKLSALKQTIVGAANSAVTWFKQKLGIHSPSRVFRGLGGHVMDGLAIGLDRGASAPIDRITRLSRDMGAALAVSAATPAFAVTGASAPGSAPASSAPVQASGGNTFHIYATANQSAEDIAREVERILDRRARADAARRRSSFRDTPDYGSA